MKEYTGGRSIVEQLLSLDIQSDYIVGDAANLLI